MKSPVCRPWPGGCPPSRCVQGRLSAVSEYTRHGTVTFLAALNVYDGTMWGCCLEANDHEHFLGALGRLVRRYPGAQRLHLILDNGSSHIAQAT
jgi:hypothetical protein